MTQTTIYTIALICIIIAIGLTSFINHKAEAKEGYKGGLCDLTFIGVIGCYWLGFFAATQGYRNFIGYMYQTWIYLGLCFVFVIVGLMFSMWALTKYVEASKNLKYDYKDKGYLQRLDNWSKPKLETSKDVLNTDNQQVIAPIENIKTPTPTTKAVDFGDLLSEGRRGK